MPYTGGELNELNGKTGISDPKQSVPVMNLIRIHKPKSKEALVQLIEYHKTNKCYCGIVSTGTVKEFGERLYKAQEKYFSQIKYTLQECIQWEYDLFVLQSLKGSLIEKKALSILKNSLPAFKIKEAQGYLDEDLRIDLIIYDEHDKIVGGIQVKPNTFKKVRPEVHYRQNTQNIKWGKPVWFLFYNKEERFQNIEDLIMKIKKHNSTESIKKITKL